uniref:L domain-like protein n=1 Tax=Attheya septentrionalis TaxID=420275 RepID=A0A7S2U7C5_9STRA|mmetsp:Transcript_13018/g.23606  ORF Transcript_13018/g.23606 Transcript_13018/m.23606 type:complete len:650 (+) Transcript_13018:53-2002(+)
MDEKSFSIGDSDEENVDHSLPSPEEVRMNSGTYRADRRSKKCCCSVRFLYISLFLVVILAAGLTIGLLARDNNKKSNGASGSSRSGKPFIPTTDAHYLRLNGVTEFLSDASSGKEMAENGTPQNLAANWIAFNDGMMLDVPVSTNTKTGARFLQRYALAVFYFSLSGDDWEIDADFLSSKSECDWNQEGMVNDRYVNWGVHCRVIEDKQWSDKHPDEMIQFIWFGDNSLDGTLPDELGLLSELEQIEISDNDVTGIIPDLSYLARLTRISLINNDLKHFPHWLGRNTRSPDLKVLALSNNNIWGTLPEDMASLTSLESLGLDSNYISGDITPIQNLRSLKYLYADQNSFEHELSESSFTGMTSLKHLDMSGNWINGSLPISFFDQPDLQVVDLHDCEITGVLPSDIDASDVQNLLFLALHDNEMTGQIPDSISLMSNLVHLDLSQNGFWGTYPASFSSLTKMVYLFMGTNDYADENIPTFVQSMGNLQELSLKSASLIGAIPEWIGTFSSKLVFLDLDFNDLTGKIPSSIANLQYLTFLLLNANDLTGTLPAAFSNAKNLELLLLDDNDIAGDINFVCNRDDAIDVFYADCGESDSTITCDCCKCCDDGDVDCNANKWHGNQNPTWQDGYERVTFRFDEKIEWVVGGGM